MAWSKQTWMALAVSVVVSWGAAREAVSADDRAREIAESVLKTMGGAEAWKETRYVRWTFFGGRVHVWDRWSGDVRIQSEDTVVLMNINTGKGRVWKAGEEVTDPQTLADALDLGQKWWTNDSYWMFMPYKLLDPGVTLRYVGEEAMEDGRSSDVLEMTFADGTGNTPRNKYLVFVAKDTGLVEQWRYYRDAADTKAQFTGPWAGWKPFGRIRLATSRGRDMDWKIAVYDKLDPDVFTDPAYPLPAVIEE